jgi:hypothetical protein
MMAFPARPSIKNAGSACEGTAGMRSKNEGYQLAAKSG